MAKKKTNLRSIAQRLSASPKLITEIGIQGASYHATACRDVIQTGMRKANLVDKLKDVTLQIKQKVGANRIKTPLMFSGDSDKKSMINGLKVVKGSSRFKLIPRGQHRSGKSQSLIWTVHEKGAMIPVTDKMRGYWGTVFGIHLSKNKKFIVIKPRFPIKKGYIRYLKSIEKKEVNDILKKAFASAIMGSKSQIKKDLAKFQQRAEKAMDK